MVHNSDHIHLLPEGLRAKVLEKRAHQQGLLNPYLDKLSRQCGTTITTGTSFEQALTNRQLEITNIDDVSELLVKLETGQYQVEETVEAYILRATLAQLKFNPLTEVLFDQALERARELDRRMKETGRPIGPLHGLPVSLKDAFDISGFDSTIGYASYISKPARTDSEMVSVLQSLGAIVFCKTNIPQALKWGETDNFIWGPTLHPDNQLLGPGGSSGGEGALQKAKGSLVGWGTDMGGSVRMPATHCGLFAVRPTTRRLSNIGVTNSMEGLGSLESVIGPMSRSLSGCRIMLEAMFSQGSSRDPFLVDIPWRNELRVTAGERKLVVGVMTIQMATDALRSAGHEVLEVNPYGHEYANNIFDKFMQLDRGVDHERSTKESGEPIFPGNMNEFQPNNIPLTGAEIMDLNRRRDAFRMAYHQHWAAWRGTSGKPVDFVICPVAAHAAPPHWKLKYYSYTKIWSLLDMPCGVVPVTTVSKHADTVRKDYAPVSEQDKQNWEKYTPGIYENCPVGIQLVATRYREEELVGYMEVVEHALNKSFGVNRF